MFKSNLVGCKTQFEMDLVGRFGLSKLSLIIFCIALFHESEQASQYQQLIGTLESGNETEVNNFLENISDINEKSDDGQTLLIKAARNGRKDIIELLLRYNADVNAKVQLAKVDLDRNEKQSTTKP